MNVTTLTDGGQQPLAIAQELASFLSAAHTSLDLALYDVNLGPETERLVIDAIDSAGRRGVAVRLAYNADFHTVVLAASGNVLLAIAAQPVFDVLQTRLVRSNLGVRFHRTINAHHRSIAVAIEAGDEDAAGGEMHDHVEFLRPFYEKAWRNLKKRA